MLIASTVGSSTASRASVYFLAFGQDSASWFCRSGIGSATATTLQPPAVRYPFEWATPGQPPPMIAVCMIRPWSVVRRPLLPERVDFARGVNPSTVVLRGRGFQSVGRVLTTVGVTPSTSARALRRPSFVQTRNHSPTKNAALGLTSTEYRRSQEYPPRVGNPCHVGSYSPLRTARITPHGVYRSYPVLGIGSTAPITDTTTLKPSSTAAVAQTAGG